MSLAIRLRSLFLPTIILPAMVLALGAGCTGLDWNRPMAWPLGPNDKPGQPDKVVAMWTDTVLHRPGRAPTRGFGGRLMFYGEDEEKPIKVEGSLAIYAFDEKGRATNNVRPDRKYVFTDEQFAKHYSKSDLGHSYSVWLPWDEVGGPQKDVSLIVRFFPTKGDVLVGKQSKHLLPGRADPLELQYAQGPQMPASPAEQNQIRQASYDAPVRGAQNAVDRERDPQRQMLTTTIDMPSRFGRQVPSAATGSRVNGRRASRQPARGSTAAEASTPADPQQQNLPQHPTSPQQQNPPQQQAFPQRQTLLQPPVFPARKPPVRVAPAQLRSDYLSARFQPPGGLAAQPTGDPRLWQQSLGGSPYRRGQEPQPLRRPGTVWTSPAAESAPSQFGQRGG